MLDFPKWMYKKNGEVFICPSQELLDGIRDKDDWKDSKWTEEELSKKCPECVLLKKNKIKLEQEIIEKDDLIELLKAKIRLSKKGL